MLKKFVCVLLVISFCFVMCSCGADKVEVVSNTEKKNIGWLDYDASGNSNVIDVRYGKCSTSSFGSYFFTPVSDEVKENEEINAFYISTICPYCNEEAGSGFPFDELPTQKLGEHTVVAKTDVVCPNWFNHTETGTSDYSASIILTLNNKD